MTHTLVAMFDTRADAERARDRLSASGFDPSEMRLHTHADWNDADRDGAVLDADAPGRHRSGFSDYFRSMVGLDDDHADVRLHEDVLRGGGTMLLVAVRDDVQVERAVDAMRECGAIDVDDRATLTPERRQPTDALGGGFHPAKHWMGDPSHSSIGDHRTTSLSPTDAPTPVPGGASAPPPGGRTTHDAGVMSDPDRTVRAATSIASGEDAGALSPLGTVDSTGGARAMRLRGMRLYARGTDAGGWPALPRLGEAERGGRAADPEWAPWSDPSGAPRRAGVPAGREAHATARGDAVPGRDETPGGRREG